MLSVDGSQLILSDRSPNLASYVQDDVILLADFRTLRRCLPLLDDHVPMKTCKLGK